MSLGGHLNPSDWLSRFTTSNARGTSTEERHIRHMSHGRFACNRVILWQYTPLRNRVDVNMKVSQSHQVGLYASIKCLYS